jgi:ATP-dependent RNA/DNA helicase IGHMBP2
VICISLVRSNDNNEIGFLNDIRRMNVALTRAKKKLIVIGDSATLGNHPFYKDFLDYIDSINAYKSAWEFIQ